jgi:lipopolysaccharide biosynthesis regulator YciM
MREQSATALSLAAAAAPEERENQLLQVVQEYQGTPAAQWATIEIGHLQMKNEEYGQAAQTYQEVLASVAEDNPLFPLVLYALAQAYEADSKFSEAVEEYQRLKEIPGFRQLGYISHARLEESQKNYPAAVAILNNYLLAIGEDPQFAAQKAEIDARIARLNALQ